METFAKFDNLPTIQPLLRMEKIVKKKLQLKNKIKIANSAKLTLSCVAINFPTS